MARVRAGDAVDTARDEIAGRISVGKRPRGVRLSADGRTLFVALSGSPKAPPGVDERTLPPPDRAADGIGVVDLATGKLARVLKSGQDPEAFDLSKDGKLLFVSNEETAEMSVVDVASGEALRRIHVGGEPEGVTTRPDGRVVYVTCVADDHVAVVDTAKWSVVAKIRTAARPRAVVFTPDGARGFVSGENGGRVDVVDARAHRVVGSVDLARQSAEPMSRSRVTQARRDADDALAFVLAHATDAETQDRCVAALVKKTEILWTLLDQVQAAASLEPRPRLARKARLRTDPMRGEELLLWPERGMRRGGSAAEILSLCDGERTLGQIVVELATRHPAAAEASIEADVRGFLDTLHARGLIEE